MKFIVISCSLHPLSRSYILALEALRALQEAGVEVELFDLRHFALEFCDAVSAHKTAEARTIIEAIRSASAILMAVPIYNYDVNAAAKNLLELGLKAWNNKLVGFLCAAGGRASYMSVMGLANSLMLDFRCLIIPRFVYATGKDFGNDRTEQMYLASDEVKARLHELVETTVKLTNALEITMKEDQRL